MLCTYFFANYTHIKQDVKKLGTIQKQLDVLKILTANVNF